MRRFTVVVLTAFLTACDASSSLTSARIASPGAALAPASSIVVQPASLSFLATGAAYAQRFGVSEAGYSGAFKIDVTKCKAVAGVKTIATDTYRVTALAAGQCAVTISDESHKTATLSIGVTVTQVGGS